MFHLGGNQWYKNRTGVVKIYNAWRSNAAIPLPLLMIGEAPDKNLLKAVNESPFCADIHCLIKIDDDTIRLAYCGASVFLFPSLAEGFGWPIAEAMASGCLVITTNEAPMTEVAGEAGFLISRRPCEEPEDLAWAGEGAEVINMVLHLSDDERSRVIRAGLENANRFRPTVALDQINSIYRAIAKKQTI